MTRRSYEPIYHPVKRRKVVRRSRGIKTTIIVPRWWRDLKAAWKVLKRNAWNALAGVGLVTLIYWVISNW